MADPGPVVPDHRARQELGPRVEHRLAVVPGRPAVGLPRQQQHVAAGRAGIDRARGGQPPGRVPGRPEPSGGAPGQAGQQEHRRHEGEHRESDPGPVQAGLPVPGVHRPGHHDAETGGSGQRERRHELLRVAQHGGPRPRADHRPEQIPSGRGHADAGDQQPGDRGDAEPGPAALARGGLDDAQQVAGQGDKHHGQPQRRPGSAVALRDRLRVPVAAQHQQAADTAERRVGPRGERGHPGRIGVHRVLQGGYQPGQAA